MSFEPSAETSTFTASSSLAQIGSTVTLTLTLEDASGSPATSTVDETLSLSVTPNDGALPPFAVLPAGQSIITLDLQEVLPGDVTVTATIGSLSLSTDVDFETVACFSRGTLISTAKGDLAVEDLEIGDQVVTASGALRPIKWIGRRSYDGRFIANRKDILPVCFKASCLSNGVPRRNLWVSPHHAMFLNGLLIEAKDLINGVSIVQVEQVDRVDYFHVELDSHDVILAEGAWSETFIDFDNRHIFHNAPEFALLYPEPVEQPMHYFAPRVQDGYELEKVRQLIAERCSFSRKDHPGDLRGSVDRVTERSIEGWAQNVEYPEAPVCLDLLANGKLIGQTLANLYREDLRSAGLGTGNHAFTFSMPDGASPTASIEVRRSMDGALLALAWRRAA